MWFNRKDIKYFKPIEVNDLRGYVIPHAGTKHTSHIISHTLRFKASNEILDRIKNVYIFYYPASRIPNVEDEYHEYYVVQQSFNYVWNTYWRILKNPKYIGINLRDSRPPKKINLNNSIIIISADFSHNLNLQPAIELENCAAHSILHNYLNLPCTNVIDHKLQFKTLYDIIPREWVLQWVGRTRSSGIKGVGYLSFLIRDNSNIPYPDGIFVTAYDKSMRQRECLGEWYTDNYRFTNRRLINKIDDVLKKASTTSRLTGGRYLDIPLHSYTITYLYYDNTRELIRGWHGIKYNAFYLPDVFLENTFDNGKWITTTSKSWPQDYNFNINETLDKLKVKSGASILGKQYSLYTSRVVYSNIDI